VQAQVISIGTELTTGQALDTNSAWLSDRLVSMGVTVTRHLTLADHQAEITTAVADACRCADVVLITGGLGPTPDDMTRAALADAAGVRLIHDETSAAMVAGFFARLERPMAESNLVQAMIPQTATVLDNPHGTAPGIRITIGSATVFAMPGVPREMKPMFENHAARWIRSRADRRAIAVRAIRTFGAGESNLAEQLGELLEPTRNPAVGTTASEGVISVRIVATADTQTAADMAADRDAAIVRQLLGSLIYGEGDDTLAGVVGAILAARRMSVSTAESCTGGLLGSTITEISGSSAYYLGGFVTYSNEQKIAAVGIDAELIAAHGAVSAPVAEAMAAGCRQKTGSDYALSITGVAGPTGGTDEKPVGLVYIGLADCDGAQHRRVMYSDRMSRTAIRDRATKYALNWLRLRLMSQE